MYHTKNIDEALHNLVESADTYKKNGNHVKLLELSRELGERYGTTANTTMALIQKDALEIAMSILESITDELPSEHEVSLLSDAFTCLPSFVNDDPDFMISISKRIAKLYDIGSQAQHEILWEFLYKLEQWIPQYDDPLAKGVPELEHPVIAKCRAILFNDKTPPLNEVGKLRLSMMSNHIASVDSSYEMRMTVKGLWVEYRRMRESGNWDELPRLQTVYGYLLEHFEVVLSEQSPDYFKTITNKDTYSVSYECSNLSTIIELLHLRSNFGVNDVYEKIQYYAEKLFDISYSDDFPLIAIHSISKAYLSLISVYEMAGDIHREYFCCVNFLKYLNLYARNKCFEQGIEVFTELLKGDRDIYYDVVCNASKLISYYNLDERDLYIELCKRKNMLYLVEAWRLRHSSTAEINRFLRHEIVLDDIHNVIQENTALIELIYICREIPDDNSAIDGYCMAYILLPSGEKKFLSQYVCSAYDLKDKIGTKGVAGDILRNLPANVTHLIVCSEGNFNSVAFGALPYGNGYVTDYYAVRNIGSIYDLIRPKKRGAIDSALIFSAPDFGEPLQHSSKISNYKSNWPHRQEKGEYLNLFGCYEEGELLADIFDEKMSITHLYGREATLDAIKSTLSEEAYSIVHFATHGKEDNGSVGLITAFANHDDNAILWDTDLRGTLLNKTAIVVYSICDGGKQTDTVADSLSGFVKFALLSGVSTVIAPLYPVMDRYTTVLIEAFYEVFLSTPNCRPEYALQQAIKRFRAIDKVELNDKYYIKTESGAEYPFVDPEFWSSWVCYSQEEMG